MYSVWKNEDTCEGTFHILDKARGHKKALLAAGIEAFITDDDDNIIEDLVTIRLTFDVSYALNGASPKDLENLLLQVCPRVICEGLLTGQTDAEIEDYSRKTVVLPEPLTEDELADFMLQRIGNGDLALEDIPIRLARYGLMEPGAFVDEMRERMGSEQ